MQLTFLLISSIQSFDKIIFTSESIHSSACKLYSGGREWSRQQGHRTGDVAGGGVAQDGHQGAEK